MTYNIRQAILTFAILVAFSMVAIQLVSIGMMLGNCVRP